VFQEVTFIFKLQVRATVCTGGLSEIGKVLLLHLILMFYAITDAGLPYSKQTGEPGSFVTQSPGADCVGNLCMAQMGIFMQQKRLCFVCK
jgi:hypothetical protein